ncbi:MAG: hypothetical protein JWP44_5007 [Mucilaginibacter sp.]|nr:hypothetical protein [Mucilaginibacter sp.]
MEEDIKLKTMAEIIGEPNDSVIEAVWKEFANQSATIEQACAQRKPPTSIEYRKMQWEATKRIIAAYNRVRDTPMYE